MRLGTSALGGLPRASAPCAIEKSAARGRQRGAKRGQQRGALWAGAASWNFVRAYVSGFGALTQQRCPVQALALGSSTGGKEGHLLPSLTGIPLSLLQLLLQRQRQRRLEWEWFRRRRE